MTKYVGKLFRTKESLGVLEVHDDRRFGRRHANIYQLLPANTVFLITQDIKPLVDMAWPFIEGLTTADNNLRDEFARYDTSFVVPITYFTEILVGEKFYYLHTDVIEHYLKLYRIEELNETVS